MRKIYFIDLFCGAGGVTTGVHRARHRGMEFAKVIACFNHDPMAIASHESNHPDTVHFLENILTADLTTVKLIVERLRREDPTCLIFIWASLECTNFSKAKGGMPRDGDSRTLADGLFRYLDLLTPDGLWIENVEEFMSWGPLDELGKPIHKRHGEDYLRWINEVQSYGYNFDFRILNAADYGAYTSRRRYFAQFMRPELPIVWPDATHSKKPSGGSLFGGELEKWKAVKDVLNFEDEGTSIFNRKKPMVEKSFERVYAGLVKYVAGGKNAFIAKYYSGQPESKVISIDGPAGTLRCKDGQALVQTSFLAKYYGNGNNIQGIDSPAGTLTTKDRFTLIQPQYWIDKQYSGPHNHQSIEQPAGAVLTNDKHSLVKTHFLLNPSWGGNPSSTDMPSPVIVARQDKAPMYLVITESGELAIEIYETDSDCVKKIKEFMAAYGIVDIKMRMLKIPELLRIQGFGDEYILKGTQADQKKFIGNAVEVNQAKVLIEAFYSGLVESSERKRA